MIKRYPELSRRPAPTKTVRLAVNLLSGIYAQVYFPTFSNGLKEIGRYLGSNWSDSNMSGTKSIALRSNWERTGDQASRCQLIQYNKEDCRALAQLTACFQALPERKATNAKPLVSVDEMQDEDDFHRWGRRDFATHEFELIADCAYFDYQRTKIYVRSNPEMKPIQRRQRERARVRNRPNKVVLLTVRQCWRCKNSEIVRDSGQWHRKLHLDLRIFPGGIKRWITEFRTPFCYCPQCKRPVVSRSYKSRKQLGHNLLAWVVHQHVTNRLSFENLETTLWECFGIRLPYSHIHGLKYEAARYYKRTYDQIVKNLVTGGLIHADETKMKLVKETGYVWVFTSLVEVAYVYRSTREGQFLHEMLTGFCGVLVTDFYAAYDSLNCQQQKCLIHLMWDINADLLKHPFDDDLKFLAGRFGVLLRSVIATVDRFGLKARFLRKHKKAVIKYCSTIATRQMTSEVAQHYRDRMLKYREKLFVFLEHDGVPWNNNNAEHAIKPIAKYRPLLKRTMNRRGVESYLVLLSISQTCEYQGLSFFEFLRSGEKDIQAFADSRRGRRRRSPTSKPKALPAEASGEK